MATNYATNQNKTPYCGVSDVKRVLQTDVSFTSSSNPTKDDVIQYIQEAQEQVDSDTGRAWRERTVTNEYQDIDPELYNHEVGVRIKLNHRFIKTLDSGEGDSLEVWNGASYEDLLANYTEGRANDFWLDYENGVLYLRRVFFVNRYQGIKITYRYGETTVPHTIRQATAIHAAVLILANEDHSFLLSETGESKNMGYDQRTAKYEARYKRLLKNFAEIVVV